MVGGLWCVVIYFKCHPNRLMSYGAVGSKMALPHYFGLYNSFLYYRIQAVIRWSAPARRFATPVVPLCRAAIAFCAPYLAVTQCQANRISLSDVRNTCHQQSSSLVRSVYVVNHGYNWTKHFRRRLSNIYALTNSQRSVRFDMFQCSCIFAGCSSISLVTPLCRTLKTLHEYASRIILPRVTNHRPVLY